MANRQLTADITNAFGPSGYEHDVVKVIKQYTEQDFDVTVDAMNNVYARLRNAAPGKPVVQLDAHSDEVGFMVQAIKANGQINFINIGGWVETNIPAHAVIIKNSRGEYIHGITTSKPPHFMTPAERSKKLELEDICIDVGAKSYDEVVNVFGIRPGDPVAPDVTCRFEERNGVFMSKAFDNRIGCQCIIETLQGVKDKELPVTPVGAFAAQEEVGCRGAMVTAQIVKPDFAIVFEGSPADDTCRDPYTAQCTLKEGVQIRVADGGMISHPGLLKWACKLADQEGIKYQVAVRRAGSTDGKEIHTKGKAVPCLVLGIPSRYAHTHYCYLAEEDLNATIALAKAVLEHLDEAAIQEIMNWGF